LGTYSDDSRSTTIGRPAGNAVVRATFDSAPDGLVVLDSEGRILVFNPALQKLWNFSDEMLASGDMVAMRAHSAEQMQDPASFLSSIERLRATGEPGFFDTVALRDGRVFERHVSPLSSVQGAPQAEGGVVVRWRDATLRVRAEEALARKVQEDQRQTERQAELLALLDLALSSADMAFWDVNIETGEVNAANDRWYSILGYAPGELVHDVDGWDALVHPDDCDARLLAWEAHISGAKPRYEAEFRMRHKEGHWVWLQARGQAVERGPDGRARRLVGTRQDISVRKRAEHWLQSLAHTDELTGINNRRRFLELASNELTRARRYGHSVALLMIDLDLFKSINDRYGHGGGDEVLRHFVQTARTVMRQSDIFARVGGEEFAALLPHATADGARAIAERLLQQTLAAPCALANGQHVAYSVSVGVAVVSAAEDAAPVTVQSLMSIADHALYEAKSQGRARVVLSMA